MKDIKPWINGPYKTIHDLPIIKNKNVIPELNKNNKSELKKNVIQELNKNNKIKEKSNKHIPWRQACVKSHELFLWESKKLTII